MSEDNKKQIEENVSTMLKMMNSVGARGNNDYSQAILNKLNNEHRTIIQNFFRTLQFTITEYSKTEHSDLRNEASVEWCKEVAKIDTYLPFV